MDEAATLARTLLPYLNQVSDYKFLGDDSHFICNRFLASLVTHICDTESSVGCGFILYALHLNPSQLQGLITNEDSVTSLKQALAAKNYPQSAIAVMTMFPDKFLWPELLNFWDGKSIDMIS